MTKYKNIFVLTTGRAGSTTFSEACRHIEGYTSTHESLNDKIGEERFNYPCMHIEIDNRLTWHLGALDEKYGADAFFVFLRRDKEKTVQSFAARGYSGIMHAFGNAGIVRERGRERKADLARFYVDTVYANIQHFLKDKHHIVVDLENFEHDFKKFVVICDLSVDLDAALRSLSEVHNTRSSHRQGWISSIRELVYRK